MVMKQWYVCFGQIPVTIPFLYILNEVVFIIAQCIDIAPNCTLENECIVVQWNTDIPLQYILLKALYETIDPRQ